MLIALYKYLTPDYKSLKPETLTDKKIAVFGITALLVLVKLHSETRQTT